MNTDTQVAEGAEVQCYAIKRDEDRFFGPFKSIEEALAEGEDAPVWAIYDEETGVEICTCRSAGTCQTHQHGCLPAGAGR